MTDEIDLSAEFLLTNALYTARAALSRMYTVEVDVVREIITVEEPDDAQAVVDQLEAVKLRESTDPYAERLLQTVIDSIKQRRGL